MTTTNPMPVSAAIAAAQKLIRVRLVSTASGGVRQYDVQYPLTPAGVIDLAHPGSRTNAPANPSDYRTAQRHARALRLEQAISAATGDADYATECGREHGLGCQHNSDWRCAVRQFVREYDETQKGESQ